jgi:hypothetical protein
MDFDGAILAHVKWKHRLHASMNGGEWLDPAVVALDTHCALGRWLCGEGRAFDVHPEFGGLLDAHAEFHRAAAEVVTAINGGRMAEAWRLVGLQSRFARASAATVHAIAALRDRAAAARPAASSAGATGAGV